MFLLLPLWGLRPILQKRRAEHFQEQSLKFEAVNDTDKEQITETLKCEEFKRKLRAKYIYISNGMIRTADIVAKLFQNEVLTAKERDEIQNLLSIPVKASEQLMNALMSKDDRAYDCFLTALIETDQKHITSILQNEDKYLDNEHSHMIRRHYFTLVDQLDVDSGLLLDRLLQSDALVPREVATIKAKSTRHEKTEMLLDLVSKFSTGNFDKFLQALKESNHEHVISIMNYKQCINIDGKIESEGFTSATDVSNTQFKESSLQEATQQIPALQSLTNRASSHKQQDNIRRGEDLRMSLLTMKRTSIRTLGSRFGHLPDELETDVSLKVATLHQETVLPYGIGVDICYRKLVEGFILKTNEVNKKQTEFEDMREIVRRVHEALKTTVVDLGNEKQRRQELETQLEQLQNESEKKLEAMLVQKDSMLSQLKHTQEQDAKVWAEEKDQLIVKMQELQKKYSECKEELLNLELQLTLVQTENHRLCEERQEHIRYIGNEKQKRKELETQLEQFQNESEKKFEALLVQKDGMLSQFKHTQEQDARVWAEEKDQLIVQMQELQKKYSECKEELLNLELQLTLVQTENYRLCEEIQEHTRSPGDGSDEENMRNVRHLLIERMDPDFGLLDKLLHLRELTFLQSGIIKSEKSIFDRNEKLLDLIFKEGRQQALLTALTDTGQKHLSNLVKGNGVYKPEYGDVWPLQERETQIVDNNRCSLVDIMDPCDLITRMFTKDVINNRQYIDINSRPNDTQKSEALLDILRRGSEENYRKTIWCLRESNQSHVAEFLEDGGVLAQVHVTIEGEREQADVAEDQILEAMANLLQNTTLPQYQRIRERLDLRIMRARKGQSIVFYIYCKTLEELLHLYELLTKGEFKKRIALVFDLMISKTETTVSEVSWSEEEFNKFKTYLESIARIRSELETACDVTQVEDELIAKCTELLSDRSLEDSPRMLEHSRLCVIAAKRDDNIRETNAQYENFALIVGINDGKTVTRDVVKINLNQPNEITTEEQIPTTMKNEAFAAVYKNTMYVAGIGINGDEIWKYKNGFGWKQCASLVQGRRRHSAAFIDKVLYICGGIVNSTELVLDSVEAFNSAINKCTAVGKLVHCVESSGNCVPFQNSLYIFGGSNKDNITFNDVQVYNTKDNTCSVLSRPMPRRYMLMRVVLWETSAILVGDKTCFIFNIETETWQERPKFKTDVIHFGLILENERLFVIGGGVSEHDKDGNVVWRCRDDVRYVPLQNIIDDKPIEWKIHGKLPKPCLVQAYENIRQLHPRAT